MGAVKRLRLTRAQLGAILGAVAVVVQDAKNPHAWATALGIVGAAFSTSKAETKAPADG